MYFSLRTTIFWNIFLLMVAAIVLISLVVFQVTEREVYKQHTLSGRMVFSSIESGVSTVLVQNPELLDAPAPESELRSFFSHFLTNSICETIFLVNNQDIVVAHSERNKIGRRLFDKDIQQAKISKTLYVTTYTGSQSSAPYLSIAGPVYVRGQQAGILKAVFSLKDVQASFQRASHMIFLYIIVDAFILIVLGFLLLSRYLVNPLKKLIRLTENISEGDLDGLPLFLSDKNEVGKLSTALKTMAERLREERAKIEQQLHALEEKNLQLRQAHREILQTEKLASVGRLAAGIAHEIGNPIGIILGYVHMLKSSGTTDHERSDFLNRIEAETERVHTIIRDLLDFAQPASQEKQQINLNDIIRDTCSLVSCQKDFRTIRFELNLAELLPAVYAHEKLLRQLVINLVLNARDAMAEAGGTLTLATGATTGDNGDGIVFTVSDTGEGICPEHQDKIFDPFFTTKEEGRGTGLGLANVHRIVELSGGSICFSSVPGKGTTFTITLPVPGS